MIRQKAYYIIYIITIILHTCQTSPAPAQTTTSRFVIRLESKTTGQLIVGADVDLYQSGVKVYDLTEEDAGLYTHNAVATGEYDVYVNGNALPNYANIPHKGKKLTTVEGQFTAAGKLNVSTALPDSQITKRYLSPTVNVLLDNPGSGSAYPPDDSGLEFKISGVDTTLGIRKSYLDSWIVASDTSSLDDLHGTYVHLLTLGGSNYRGGGAIQRALKTTYPINNVTSFAHANTDSVWVRSSFLDGGPIHGEWAGIVADGSTDDATALQLATTVAKANNRPLELPGGDIYIETTWDIKNTTAQHIGFWAYGSTRGETQLTGADGIGRVISCDGTGGIRGQIVLEGFSVFSSSASLNDTGLVMIKAGNSYIDLKIGDNGKAFSCGFYAEEIDHSVFHFANNYNDVNIHFGGTTNNGITIFGGGNSATLYNMKLETFVGRLTGEGGNSPIGLQLKGSNVVLEGYNWESCDSVFVEFKGPNPSTLTVLGSRFLGVNATTDDVIARLETDGDRIYWMSGGFSQINADSQIVVTANRGYVTAEASLVANGALQTPIVYWQPGDIFYRAGPTIPITLTSGLLGPSVYDENRGRIFNRLSSGTGDDRLVVPSFTDSGYVEIDLLQGSRVLFGTNTQTPSARIEGLQWFYGNDLQTFNPASSPISVTYTLDASGVADFVYISNPALGHVTGQDTVIVDSLAIIENLTGGTFTYKFWFHTIGGATANANIYYSAAVKD